MAVFNFGARVSTQSERSGSTIAQGPTYTGGGFRDASLKIYFQTDRNQGTAWCSASLNR